MASMCNDDHRRIKQHISYVSDNDQRTNTRVWRNLHGSFFFRCLVILTFVRMINNIVFYTVQTLQKYLQPVGRVPTPFFSLGISVFRPTANLCARVYVYRQISALIMHNRDSASIDCRTVANVSREPQTYGVRITCWFFQFYLSLFFLSCQKHNTVPFPRKEREIQRRKSDRGTLRFTVRTASYTYFTINCKSAKNR